MQTRHRFLPAFAALGALCAGLAVATPVSAQPVDPRTRPSVVEPTPQPPVHRSVLNVAQANELLGLLERVGRECLDKDLNFICEPIEGRLMIRPTSGRLLLPPNVSSRRFTSGPGALGIRFLACQQPEFRDTEVCRKAQAPASPRK
jgi:hypothetical protein